VDETSDGFEITAPGTVNWTKEKALSAIPIRLVRRIGEHDLNVIALVQSETQASIRIQTIGRDVEIVGDMEMFVVGKGLCSEETPCDSWICSCGAIWSSYRIAAKNAFRGEFE
jgi:hypothetical protein